jgi:hypothetical protein
VNIGVPRFGHLAIADFISSLAWSGNEIYERAASIDRNIEIEMDWFNPKSS